MPTATKERLREIFQISVWRLNESADKDPRIDGDTFIAVAEGKFATANGNTRNGRFYPRELWENVIARVTPQINESGMFGTVGHDRPLDDDAVYEGAFTHKVTKLYLDHSTNEVMGEMLIMNTPAGQNLARYMRAGMPLAVSSRAVGTFKGITNEGYKIVDPETFVLEAFDIVVNPGVPDATPKITESLNEDCEDMNENGTSNGLLKLNETLTAQTVELKVQLNEAASENRALKARLAELEKVNEAMSLVGGQDPTKALKKLHERMWQWFNIPELKEYAKESGMFTEDGGDPSLFNMVNKMLSVTESYTKLGTPKQMIAERELLDKYKDFGTLDELRFIEKTMRKYIKLGMPEEISERFEASTKVLQADTAKKIKSNAKAIVEWFAKRQITINPVGVEKMLESSDLKTVVARLKELHQVGGSTKNRLEGKKKVVVNRSNLSESKATVLPFAQHQDGPKSPLLRRINERLELGRERSLNQK